MASAIPAAIDASMRVSAAPSEAPRMATAAPFPKETGLIGLTPALIAWATVPSRLLRHSGGNASMHDFAHDGRLVCLHFSEVTECV